MFDYIEPPEKEPTDYTGTKIGAILAPVLLLFAYFGKEDRGFTICLVLGVAIFAIKMRWKLRKRRWFWPVIVFILLLHVPLFFVVRWPQTNVPTIAYSMPLGIADGLLILGAIGLAERFFSKGSSSDDEE
jgi:hypothetical protein